MTDNGIGYRREIVADLLERPIDELSDERVANIYDTAQREARYWIEDTFDDAPAGLNGSEVWAAIRRYYDGGIGEFGTALAEVIGS